MRRSRTISCLTVVVALVGTTASAQTLQRQTTGPTRTARIALPAVPAARKPVRLSIPQLTRLGRQLTGNPQITASVTTLHFVATASPTDPELFLFKPFLRSTTTATVLMTADSAAGLRVQPVGTPKLTGSALFVCSVKSDKPLTWSAFTADDASTIGGPVQQTDDGAVFTVDLAQIDAVMPVRLESDAPTWQFWSCDATILK